MLALLLNKHERLIAPNKIPNLIVNRSSWQRVVKRVRLKIPVTMSRSNYRKRIPFLHWSVKNYQSENALSVDAHIMPEETIPPETQSASTAKRRGIFQWYADERKMEIGLMLHSLPPSIRQVLSWPPLMF